MTPEKISSSASFSISVSKAYRNTKKWFVNEIIDNSPDEILSKGVVQEEDVCIPPYRSPTSESQRQSVFPIKAMDGADVVEVVSKTRQNEEVTKKEDDRMDLVDDAWFCS